MQFLQDRLTTAPTDLNTHGSPTVNRPQPKHLLPGFKAFPSGLGLSQPRPPANLTASLHASSTPRKQISSSPTEPSAPAAPSAWSAPRLCPWLSAYSPSLPSQGAAPSLSEGIQALVLGRPVIEIIFKMIQCCYFFIIYLEEVRTSSFHLSLQCSLHLPQ